MKLRPKSSTCYENSYDYKIYPRSIQAKNKKKKNKVLPEIKSKLIELSNIVHSHIYKKKYITKVQASSYLTVLKEIQLTVPKSKADELQVCEKLINQMKFVVIENDPETSKTRDIGREISSQIIFNESPNLSKNNIAQTRTSSGCEMESTTDEESGTLTETEAYNIYDSDETICSRAERVEAVFLNSRKVETVQNNLLDESCRSQVSSRNINTVNNKNKKIKHQKMNNTSVSDMNNLDSDETCCSNETVIFDTDKTICMEEHVSQIPPNVTANSKLYQCNYDDKKINRLSKQDIEKLGDNILKLNLNYPNQVLTVISNTDEKNEATDAGIKSPFDSNVIGDSQAFVKPKNVVPVTRPTVIKGDIKNYQVAINYEEERVISELGETAQNHLEVSKDAYAWINKLKGIRQVKTSEYFSNSILPKNFWDDPCASLPNDFLKDINVWDEDYINRN